MVIWSSKYAVNIENLKGKDTTPKEGEDEEDLVILWPSGHEAKRKRENRVFINF